MLTKELEEVIGDGTVVVDFAAAETIGDTSLKCGPLPALLALPFCHWATFALAWRLHGRANVAAKARHRSILHRHIE